MYRKNLSYRKEVVSDRGNTPEEEEVTVKVEKTEFFTVFSTFDRDTEIIM